MTESNISAVLRALMYKHDIKTTELARRTKLPQQTLQRIVSGVTPRPHASSLVPLAEYFELKVEQIKGIEPIDNLELNLPNSRTTLKKLYIIPWSCLESWPILDEEIKPKCETIYTDAEVSDNSFALRMQDSSMEPVYPQGTILIIDPNKVLKDRRYVIAKLNKDNEPILRWLLIDGQNKYLKPLSPDFKQFAMTKIGKDDVIYGVLVQARYDLVD